MKTKKILYTNGCSWTAGYSIMEDPGYISNPQLLDDQNERYALSWSAVLQKKLGIPNLVNDALGGGSNNRMVRMTCSWVLEYLKDNSPDDLFVIIGWTEPNRNEIFYDSKWERFNMARPFSETIDPPRTDYHIDRIDKIKDDYLTWVQNAKYDLTHYFQTVMLMSNFLENQGIDFLFFNSIPCIDDWSLPFNDYVNSDFQPYIDYKINHKSIITEMSMYWYMEAHKISLSPCLHPMIEGHSRWAEYLNSYIEENHDG